MSDTQSSERAQHAKKKTRRALHGRCSTNHRFQAHAQTHHKPTQSHALTRTHRKGYVMMMMMMMMMMILSRTSLSLLAFMCSVAVLHGPFKARLLEPPKIFTSLHIHTYTHIYAYIHTRSLFASVSFFLFHCLCVSTPPIQDVRWFSYLYVQNKPHLSLLARSDVLRERETHTQREVQRRTTTHSYVYIYIYIQAPHGQGCARVSIRCIVVFFSRTHRMR